MTHRGLVRPRNEDSFVVRRDLGLFVVADGVAQHGGGALASFLATRSVVRFFQRSRRRLPLDLRQVDREQARFLRAFYSANQRVLSVAERYPQHHGMATTLAAIAVVGNHAVLAHIGDSRIYRVRGRQIERMTMDHSVAEDTEWRNENPRAPDLNDPDMQHLLTEVIGRSFPMRVATRIESIQPRDVYLLCSDGLHGIVWEDLIMLGIRQYRLAIKPRNLVLKNVPHRQAFTLIKMALNRGAPDNVTVVVLRIGK